jgi:SAM-dependent methyltransferase
MNNPGRRITSLLAHPRLRGLALDDPRTTYRRREIIQSNSFLRQIYTDWYEALMTVIPSGPGEVLELGSGGGFLERYVPLISSEVFFCPYVKAILDGQALPFADGSLRAIVMTEVLHHIPQPGIFLQEASRCTRPGGVVAMVEPWVTPWSTWVYQHLHHEPFDPTAPQATFPVEGPLSGANGAIPWMLFARDQGQFLSEFPQWKITTIRLMMPFLYLISGGVSMRQLMPGWSYKFWHRIEALLDPGLNSTAMFALIVLRRCPSPIAELAREPINSHGC